MGNNDNIAFAFYRTAVIKILCALYGMMIVSLGLVLPLASQLSRLSLEPLIHPLFHEAFLIFLYVVSMVCLFLLAAFVLHHADDMSPTVEAAAGPNDARHIAISHPTERVMSLARKFSTLPTNLIASPRVQRLKSTSHPMEMGEYQSDGDNLENFPSASLPRRSIATLPRQSLARSSLGFALGISGDGSDSASNVGNEADGNFSPRVSFFLRLGVVLFGLGSMVHSGFRLAEYFEFERSHLCRSGLHIPLNILHGTFVFVQGFLVFKSDRVYVVKLKGFARFALTHLVATNLCGFLYWLVIQSSEEHFYYLADSNRNLSMPVVHDATVATLTTSAEVVDQAALAFERIDGGCHDERLLSNITSTYLYPCTAVYTLMSAAVLYHLYRRAIPFGVFHSAGQHDDAPAAERGYPYSLVASSVHAPTTADSGSSFVDCEKANKGFFFGILVVGVLVVTLGSFFLLQGKLAAPRTAYVILYTTEFGLLFLAGLGSIIGMFRLSQLRFDFRADLSFETRIQVIGLAGVYVFDAFIGVSSAATVGRYDLLAHLSLALSLLSFFQATVQTIFVLDALRRFADGAREMVRKPGRPYLTFLIICNLALWLLEIFAGKKVNLVRMHAEFFGHLGWTIIQCVFIPLCILYRFHSAVCLVTVWSTAFRRRIFFDD